MHARLPLRTKPGLPRAKPDFYRHIAGLEEKLTTLRGQVRQAQQLAGLGTATAMLAHEVNNLLTPIVGYAHGALENGNDALQKKALKITIKNSRMLVAMSERILRISAVRPAGIEAVPVPVRACADEAVECLCRGLSKDGITFLNEVDQGICVQADVLAVQQVFFNLFLNARDAMAPNHGGTLSVHARHAEDCIEIQVKDTGGGIPEALLPLVFEPLQSSKRSDGSRPARCSGLGLALCRDVIVEHGGTIGATTNAGIGTTFTIHLPAATANATKESANLKVAGPSNRPYESERHPVSRDRSASRAVGP